MDGLKENFIIEAVELLDEAEEALLDIDKGKDFKQSYNSIFRAFHSLKGASGMFGINELQEHLHKLETLLTHINGEFPEGATDYFLKGIDASREFFETDKLNFEYIDSFSKGSEQTDKIAEDVKVDPPNKEVQIKDKGEDRDLKSNKKFQGYAYVVDDEPLIVELVSEILEGMNVRVRSFLDGEEVLKAIDDDHPDIILSDIKMPKVDGLTMLKKLDESGLKIPIIFISGFVTKDAVLAGLKSGARYFIEKPLDDKRIISLVDSVLKNVKAKRLIEKSLDYVMYQFANQEKILIESGRENEVELIKNEIKKLVNLSHELFS
mgnify:FL=1